MTFRATNTGRYLAGACIAAATTAATLTGQTPAAAAGTVQVTKVEYQRVELGMRAVRVHRIVDSTGKIISDNGICRVEKYRAWKDTDVYFYFGRDDETDPWILDFKQRLSHDEVPTLCGGAA